MADNGTALLQRLSDALASAINPTEKMMTRDEAFAYATSEVVAAVKDAPEVAKRRLTALQSVIEMAKKAKEGESIRVKMFVVEDTKTDAAKTDASTGTTETASDKAYGGAAAGGGGAAPGKKPDEEEDEDEMLGKRGQRRFKRSECVKIDDETNPEDLFPRDMNDLRRNKRGEFYRPSRAWGDDPTSARE